MFNNARVKLTAWYLLIIMSISIIFSAVIYFVLANEVLRFERSQRYRIESRLNIYNLPPNIELIEDVSTRILLRLMVINLGILIATSVLGYLLAGRTLKPIAQMIEEQKRFISDASHELKTPLTSLKSAFEVYLRDKKPSIAESKQLVKESVEEVNRLQKLTESLLEFTQLDNQMELSDLENIPISDIVNEAVRQITPVAKIKNIKISKNITNVSIYGSKPLLINLLVIILDNAVKYSPQKSLIEIASFNKGDHKTISIKDHGVGISQLDLPHIFDRFYRSDKARTFDKSTPGYGLGLSIAKRIADIHNAKINVISKVGKGSEFKISFLKGGDIHG